MVRARSPERRAGRAPSFGAATLVVMVLGATVNTLRRLRPASIVADSSRWREHAAIILLNVAVLGGFATRVADPRSSAIRIDPPPTLTPAPPPTPVRLSVYVSGAVIRPGVVSLAEGARVGDALRESGGFAADAARDHVNLASPVGDGQQVHVPRLEEVDGRLPAGLVPGGGAAGAIGGGVASGPGPASAVGAEPGPGPGLAGASGSGPETGVGSGGAGHGAIDINRADATMLDRLPGVGPALAARIVAHRDANGPFASVDSLVDVPGIGPKTLERMRGMITVQ